MSNALIAEAPAQRTPRLIGLGDLKVIAFNPTLAEAEKKNLLGVNEEPVYKNVDLYNTGRDDKRVHLLTFHFEGEYKNEKNEFVPFKVSEKIPVANRDFEIPNQTGGVAKTLINGAGDTLGVVIDANDPQPNAERGKKYASFEDAVEGWKNHNNGSMSWFFQKGEVRFAKEGERELNSFIKHYLNKKDTVYLEENIREKLLPIFDGDFGIIEATLAANEANEELNLGVCALLHVTRKLDTNGNVQGVYQNVLTTQFFYKGATVSSISNKLHYLRPKVKGEHKINGVVPQGFVPYVETPTVASASEAPVVNGESVDSDNLPF